MHIVRSILAGAAVSVLLIGCSAGASPTAPATAAPASVAPTEAPASVAPSEAPASVAPSSAAGATVDAKPVGTIGTVLVAKNGVTSLQLLEGRQGQRHQRLHRRLHHDMAGPDGSSR